MLPKPEGGQRRCATRRAVVQTAKSAWWQSSLKHAARPLPLLLAPHEARAHRSHQVGREQGRQQQIRRRQQGALLRTAPSLSFNVPLSSLRAHLTSHHALSIPLDHSSSVPPPFRAAATATTARAITISMTSPTATTRRNRARPPPAPTRPPRKSSRTTASRCRR